MNKKEIKRENRRALPKFILVLVIAMIVGWTGGYLSGKFRMDAFAEGIRNTGTFFGTHIAPWLTVAVAVIVPTICIPIYRSAKKLLGAWDGEDEDISDEIDRKLSSSIWISSASLVLSYFLIAAAYSGGFAMFESKERTIVLFIAIAAFFAVMVEAVILQQKCIDTAKQTNPEKKASVYDMRFQKSGWRTATKPKKL